ncbi:MAG: hypothetical protein KatS3mg101_1143 [Patescibacteria group bacterium]|nr:MAG: hypothetical protein KatS3mg101_1143 [Patescibacteria group bacterium]
MDFMLSSGFFAEVADTQNNETRLEGFPLPHPNYIIAGKYGVYQAYKPDNTRTFVPEPVYSCPPMSFISDMKIDILVQVNNNKITRQLRYLFFANDTIGFKLMKNSYNVQPKFYWEDLFENTCFPQTAWPVINKRLTKYDYMPQQSFGNFLGGVYAGFSEIYNYSTINTLSAQQGGNIPEQTSEAPV